MDQSVPGSQKAFSKCGWTDGWVGGWTDRWMNKWQQHYILT